MVIRFHSVIDKVDLSDVIKRFPKTGTEPRILQKRLKKKVYVCLVTTVTKCGVSALKKDDSDCF